MCKKIVISGWYGFGNIGDEAILQAMIDTFEKKWKDCEIVVLSFNPEYTMNTQKVNAVHQIPISGIKVWIKNIILFRWIKTLKAIQEGDIFIMGGGGFLSDWQPEVPAGWLKQMKIAKLFGKKTMLYGIGAGPFLTDKGKKVSKYYIDNFVDEITVRDQISFDYLYNLGILKVKLTADPVYNVDIPKKTFNINSKLKIFLSFPEMFHTSLWKDNTYHYGKYINSIENIIDILETKSIDYQFVSFMKNHDDDFIKKTFNKDSFSVESSDQLPELFVDCNPIVVGLRYHFNLLSLVSGIPIIPIVYHHKVFSMAKDFNIEYLEVGNGENWQDSEIDIDKLMNIIKDLTDNYENAQVNIKSNVIMMQEREFDNCNILASLVSKK